MPNATHDENERDDGPTRPVRLPTEVVREAEAIAREVKERTGLPISAAAILGESARRGLRSLRGTSEES